ncbi:MAG: PQQ-binding-like beta-propeller repeat protein [Gemmataceae bacterium]
MTLRFCLLLTALLLPTAARADDWPGWLGPKRDGVWRETGLLDTFPPGGPAVRWRVPLGAGYSGPAVVGDRVYVMDRQSPQGLPNDAAPQRGAIPGSERVLCLDATTGKVIWKHEYDCPYTRISYPTGPRTTPAVHAGKVYTLGTMGDLLCLDADKGTVVWSKNLAAEYKAKPPVWGYSASPLIDGDRLVTLAGGDGSAVVALDLATGKEVWKSLTAEEVGYSPPVLVEAAGRRQVVVFLDQSLAGLDPATGKPLWQVDYPADPAAVQRPSVSIAMARPAGDTVFVASFYHGPLLVKLTADPPGAAVVWRGTSNNPQKPDGLHAVMATPWVQAGHIYGTGGFGELSCVDAATNKTVWTTTQPLGVPKAFCGTAFIVPQGERFVLFTDQGDLILAKLSPAGYAEQSRAHLIDPSQTARGRTVVWSHPAFAGRCVFVRNDKEMACVSLAAS